MYEYGPQGKTRYQTMGAATGTSTGTVLTSAASAVPGSWVSLGTTLFSFEEFVVQFIQDGSATLSLVDIGIDDGAGNVNVIAQSIWSGCNAGDAGGQFVVPVHVPSGSAVVARVSKATAAQTITMILVGCSVGRLGNPGFARMVLLSPIAANTAVPNVAITTGIANTKARVELTPSSSIDVKALIYMIGQIAGTASVRALIDLETGPGGSEQVLMANVPWRTGVAGSSGYSDREYFVGRAFPAATRFSVNGQSNTVGSICRCLLYGLQ